MIAFTIGWRCGSTSENILLFSQLLRTRITFGTFLVLSMGQFIRPLQRSCWFFLLDSHILTRWVLLWLSFLFENTYHLDSFLEALRHGRTIYVFWRCALWSRPKESFHHWLRKPHFKLKYAPLLPSSKRNDCTLRNPVLQPSLFLCRPPVVWLLRGSYLSLK